MELEAAMEAREPVTVPVFYRGQPIGTRTFHHNRLVFAALRSLDAMHAGAARRGAVR